MISSLDQKADSNYVANSEHLHKNNLFPASQIDCDKAVELPLALILKWVRNFLSKPHSELGRPGPVCPFTPHALNIDSIWLTEIVDPNPNQEKIAQIIANYRDVFLELEPRTGPSAVNKAILIVFPYLGQAGSLLIDSVQAELKKRFVDVGLMLGEFHLANESPGLRNESFRPLRSPLPMLAIRHMVESDLPFLRRSMDDPALRASYLRSYLRLLGGSLKRNYFEQALEALVDAEIELRCHTLAVAETAISINTHNPAKGVGHDAE
jgi:hypothetical protein